jgi:rifampicin phosphotransferase
VAGRRKNWEMLHRKEVELPKFLHRNSGVVEEAKTGYNSEGQLVISGSGTSRGEIVAIARIVKNLDQISRVNKGEILITNSTDPGWTPVFALLSAGALRVNMASPPLRLRGRCRWCLTVLWFGSTVKRGC